MLQPRRGPWAKTARISSESASWLIFINVFDNYDAPQALSFASSDRPGEAVST